MVQPEKAQSRTRKPHRTLRCGNVNVYRITRSDRNPYYQVADYTLGERRLRTFSDETKAIEEAKRIARSLARGDVTAAKLSNSQAASFARATEQIEPTGDSIEIDRRLENWPKMSERI